VVVDIRTTRNPENSGRILIQPGVQVDFFANGRNLAGSEFAGTFQKNPLGSTSFIHVLHKFHQPENTTLLCSHFTKCSKKNARFGLPQFVSEIILLTYFPRIWRYPMFCDFFSRWFKNSSTGEQMWTSYASIQMCLTQHLWKIGAGRSGEIQQFFVLSKKEKMMKLHLLLKISWRIECLILYMEITMFFAYIQKQLNLNMSGIQGPKRTSNCFATLMKWSKHSWMLALANRGYGAPTYYQTYAIESGALIYNIHMKCSN